MTNLENAGSPITCLITDGRLTNETFTDKSRLTIETIRNAVKAGISLIQIREKQLSVKNLFQLASEAVQIATNSQTKILINDRADVAAASGADGVHLTEVSLPVETIRKSFSDLIVGVSTHSVESVIAARTAGADFALFGPVFRTPGKGTPQGLEKLGDACRSVPGFPVLAIGGIDGTNYRQALDAGARGFASIGFLNSEEGLRALRNSSSHFNIGNGD